jgi:Bacterial SH3 domain
VWAALCAALLGCSMLPPSSTAQRAEEVRRRAQEQRTEQLEQEVTRLRADLERAEEALVAAESGLRSSHSRADAVSALAEARIQVERAARQAPWREDETAEARAKLDEADRKVKAGYFGSALFFVYRSKRIASELEREAEQVQATPGTRFVLARRANLRADPNTEGEVVQVLTRGTPVFPEAEHAGWLLVRTPAGPPGWIYSELVSEPATTTQSLPASLAR